MNPLVSVIVPVYDQVQYIEATLDSLFQQTYAAIEIIVVDGGSQDGTRKILEDLTETIQWVSEPDRGQSHAINKGIRMATGDILAWLNADDQYYPYTIQTVVDYFRTQPTSMFLYGDAMTIDADGKPYGLRPYVQATDYQELLNVRCRIVQPSTFWRRIVTETVGTLDENLHYSMDYEYWIRIAREYTLDYLPIPLAYERLHANAKSTQGNLKRVSEIELIATTYGRDEVPDNFRGEVAATYIFEGLAHLLKLQFLETRAMFKRALKLRPPILKCMRYIFVLLLPNAYRVKIWLYLSKLKTYKR
jgi:glycosyltransferase involved in cell wall biosynthesis